MHALLVVQTASAAPRGRKQVKTLVDLRTHSHGLSVGSVVVGSIVGVVVGGADGMLLGAKEGTGGLSDIALQTQADRGQQFLPSSASFQGAIETPSEKYS